MWNIFNIEILFCKMYDNGTIYVLCKVQIFLNIILSLSNDC